MNKFRYSLNPAFLCLNLLDLFPLHFAENLMNYNSFGFWQIDQPGGGQIMPPKSLLNLPFKSFRPSTIPVFFIAALAGTFVIGHGQVSTTQMAL